MNLQEVLNEVLGITARPDRQVESISAINAAVSLYSLKANFAYDLVESTLTVDPALYGDTLQFNNVSPTALVTRFRKFKYVKPTGVKRYLKLIGSDQIFQPGEVTQLDRYYVGGNNITYTLKELTPTLEIGYYQHPPVLDLIVTPTYWMLDLVPWMIIDKASARIMRSIGDDTSATAYERSSQELFTAARRDFEDAVLVGAQ